MLYPDRSAFLEPSPDESSSGSHVGRTLSRRKLFAVMGSAPFVLMAACSSVSKNNFDNSSFVTEPTIIRRDVGEWSQDEIKALASNMIGDPQLNDVAFAGQVLMDNQEDNPSFSRMSRVFSDDKLSVGTVKKITGFEDPTPISTGISARKPDVRVSLKSKRNGSVERFLFYPGLRLERITFGYDLTKDKSDLLLGLYMAKGIYSVAAVDRITDYLAHLTYYTQYETPEDEKDRSAVQAGMMDSGIGHIPTPVMADYWASYMLVPNFLKAVDQKKLSLNEAEGEGTKVFRFAGDFFQREGVLTRDGEGDYKWTDDANKLYNTWLDLSLNGVQTLKVDKAIPS